MFKVGDKVKNINPPHEEGVVWKAKLDESSSSGEWYEIDFGKSGIQASSGERFIKISSDFI